MAESFHTDAEVPAGTNFNDSAALSMGLYFSVGVDGTVTHARWRAADSVTGTVKWGLYRLSDSVLLGEQDFTTYTQGAWNTIALTTPIPVSAAVSYAAVYWSPNYYVATSAYFPAPITRGDITAPAQAGRFVEPSADIGIPASAFNDGCYFVDVVFAPATSGTSPTGIAVPVTVGQPSAALGLTATPTGVTVPVAVGNPAAGLNLSAAPAGISVPVAVGAPSTTYPLSSAPTGIAVPVTVGSPATAFSGASPAGITVPVAVGAPATSAAIPATPAGIAVPVQVGSPSAGAASVSRRGKFTAGTQRARLTAGSVPASTLAGGS